LYGFSIACCELRSRGLYPDYLPYPDIDQFLAVRVGNVHGAGDAGIKAVDGTQYLDRRLGIIQGMVVLQRRLIGPRLADQVRAFPADGRVGGHTRD
jgi:hypothetical protein